MQLRRLWQFKPSGNSQFVAKLRDIAGPYIDPPAHVVVRSVDEKSYIWALDRTQRGLPLRKDRCGTMSGTPPGSKFHDYTRNETTTLFAALSMQYHRHQEFVRFFNTIEAKVPAGKLVHVVLDNYAAHK